MSRRGQPYRTNPGMLDGGGAGGQGKISWRAAQDPTDTETAGGLKRFIESPERNLMLAVLEDATRRYLKYPASATVPEREWFASEAQEPLFAFRSICATLGISADWYLKQLTTGGAPDVQRYQRYRTVFSPNLGNGLNYRQISAPTRFERRVSWPRRSVRGNYRSTRVVEVVNASRRS